MKATLLQVLIFLMLSSVKAQPLFNKRYGSIHTDRGTAITATKDGGFAVTGVTEARGASGDIFLMKLDSTGSIEWTKDIFGVFIDNAVAIFQLPNGNYFIGGQTYSYGSGCTDAIAIVLDSTGGIIWANAYGDINCNGLLGFSQTRDGGYIGCGVAVGGTQPGWLFKIDKNGALQWSKSYQTPMLSSVKQTSDGGFIAVAYYGGINVLKIDSNGIPQWYKSYITSATNTQSYDIQVLDEEGSAVISGEVYYNAYGAEPDIYLLKINQNGDRIWFKTYGFTFFEYGMSVKRTLDGGYIIGGRTNSYGNGDYDAVLLKASGNGDLLWAKTYGDIWYDEAAQVQILKDSGFVFVGRSYSNSDNQDSSYTYVVKTDKNGNTSCNYMDWAALQQTQVYDPTTKAITATVVCIDSICHPTVYNLSFSETSICSLSSINEKENKGSINIFPNPTKDIFNISIDKYVGHSQVNLFNIMGEKVYSDDFRGNNSAINCKLNSGIYLVQIINEKGTWIEKLIKE